MSESDESRCYRSREDRDYQRSDGRFEDADEDPRDYRGRARGRIERASSDYETDPREYRARNERVSPSRVTYESLERESRVTSRSSVHSSEVLQAAPPEEPLEIVPRYQNVLQAAAIPTRQASAWVRDEIRGLSREEGLRLARSYRHGELPVIAESELESTRELSIRGQVTSSTHPSSRRVVSQVLSPAPRWSSGSTASTQAASSVLTENLEKLKLTSFIVRPGYGKIGRQLVVRSNYFAARAAGGGRAKLLYHYDVDINPVVAAVKQAKPIGLLRAVWEQLVIDQTNSEWARALLASAFDGRKNCFTPIRLPVPEGNSQRFITVLAPDGAVQGPRRESSSSEDEGRRFKIVIKHIANIDLEAVMSFCRTDEKAPSSEEKCLTGLMATNVLLRDLPSKKYTQVGAIGNKFFSLEGAVPLPQGGVVCKGFAQSFRYSSSGNPILNLDLGFSAFLASGPALDVINQILGDHGPPARGGDRDHGTAHPCGPARLRRELQLNEIMFIKAKLRGAKFRVTHRASPRLHTILSITRQSAEEITFLISGKDGMADRKISVVQYYKEFYGCEVERPRLPCVQYASRAFIPLEFVHLADFNSLPPLKLSAQQTAEMIKVSAVKPEARAKATMAWRKELAYETQSKIKAWGLEINTEMIKIRARVLDPPRVMYANNNDAMPRDGGWKLRGKQFIQQGKRPLKAWSFIIFDRYFDADDVRRFVEYLCRTLEALGISVPNKRPDIVGPINPNGEGNIKNALKMAARKAFMAGNCSPQLICVVLPGRDAWLYEAIKKSSFTDLKGPVPTQCMQARKLRDPRGIQAYTDNLAMKIQAKLGGLTHQVPTSDLPGVERGKTMLLGADLGHAPIRGGQNTAPTVACSIATYNADCDKYSAQIRLQEGRGEIVVDLSSMVEAHLQIFHDHNGTYPERILVFRDGISEGQYAAALQYEHDAILRACERLLPDYRPRILVCICAKRHNTRFFAVDDRDTDRTGNLRSGLVVDKGVTHPYAFDFFLQAHAGLIGTARPTHYICLLDELPITPDQLQQLVHSLCYSFARCTSAVSLVPVCYIADLVCQKARIIVQEPQRNSSGVSHSSGGTNAHFGSRAGPPVLDHMEVQKILAKNPELADVIINLVSLLQAWWM